MMKPMLHVLAIMCAALLAAPQTAAAQDEDEAWLAGDKEPEAAPEEGAAEGAEATAVEADESKPEGEDDAWLEGKEVKEVEGPEEDTTYTLKELPKKWYYGLGARMHYLLIPSGVIELFPVEKAPTVMGYTAGIEAVFRRDGLSIVPHISFSQVKGSGPFQEDGDPDTDIEWWDNDLKLLIIGVEFYGSVKIKDWVQYYYGAGISFFFRLGDDDMVRTEGYIDPSSGKIKPCEGPGLPDLPGLDCQFCEDSSCGGGGHYGNNWGGWAADPFYIPYINVTPLGFRFKPIPNLYINVDASLVLPLLPRFGVRMGYLF
jgi:hypothetical protein